jgi:hypothetical protein
LRDIKHYRSKLVTSMEVDYILSVLDEIEDVYSQVEMFV